MVERTQTSTGLLVRYSCELCGIDDAEVEVPFRHEKEDIVDWMRQTGVFLGADHQRRSPHCTPRELKRVKIPMPVGTQFIGGKQEQ